VNRDDVTVVLIAAVWSGAVVGTGLLFTVRLRRTSLRWVPAAVAVVAVLAVLAGTVGTARAMFLSSHDFRVVLIVSAVAGLISLTFAVGVGAAVARSTRLLREGARELGETGRFIAVAAGPADLAELSTELARTSQKLRESRATEGKLEQSRRDLVSWVSHDLRTPLAGLRAMSEALQDGLVEDPDRYHRQMTLEVDRMVVMVDDLFELSRIHAGALGLKLRTVALADLVSDTIATADPVARANGVSITGSVEGGVQLRADPAELSRALGNLLMNGVRHTPADGVVHVLGRVTGNGVELAVRDGCGGIPPQDLGHVFEVAWRGTAARTPTADGGAGLGLAIVKGIIEAHRGTVSVRNEGLGCSFRVHLPQ
jgi:signal transduction histidine kinase